MTIDDHNNRDTAKILASSSGKIDNYEYVKCGVIEEKKSDRTSYVYILSHWYSIWKTHRDNWRSRRKQ